MKTDMAKAQERRDVRADQADGLSSAELRQLEEEAWRAAQEAAERADRCRRLGLLP